MFKNEYKEINIVENIITVALLTYRNYTNTKIKYEDRMYNSSKIFFNLINFLDAKKLFFVFVVIQVLFNDGPPPGQ